MMMAFASLAACVRTVRYCVPYASRHALVIMSGSKWSYLTSVVLLLLVMGIGYSELDDNDAPSIIQQLPKTKRGAA